MDRTEELSARVLLRHILGSEPPRTPVTRSKAQSPGTTRRRSSRLKSKDAAGQTPQEMLRRSLRQKMTRESITRKSLPLKKTAARRGSIPSAASVTFNDEDTPRHILKNILMTEPVRSPVVHQRTEAETEEPHPSPVNSSVTVKEASIELSGLDLPDVTMGIAPSVTRKLSRKRQRQSLNITAFEKRLKGGDDVGEEHEQSENYHSSLSLSSSTSLSLKTPFADVQTEKRGLKRRVSNRRKITEEQFGAAVNKMEMQGASSFVGLGLSDTAYSEGFTLGLSKLSKPDITTDILHCDTTVDAQPHAASCDVSQSEVESRPRSHYKEEETAQDFQNEEGDGGGPQPEVDVAATSQSQEEEEEEETAQDSKTEEGDGGGTQPEVDVAATSQFQEDEEEKETAQDSKTEEGDGGGTQPEVDVAATSQSQEEEEEETDQDSQSEEGGGDTQPEVDVSATSQSEEEENVQDSQTEGGSDCQPEEDVSASSQSQEEEEEETAQDFQRISVQPKELSAVDCPSDEIIADDEMAHKNVTKEDIPHSPTEDEEVEENGDEHTSEEEEHDEHISQGAHCSGGGVIYATETGGDTSENGRSEDKSKANGVFSLNSNLEMGDDDIDHPEDLADKENNSEGSRRLNATAQESAELETEWDDEEESDVPSKTPAFVREKRVFSQNFVKKIQPSGKSESSPTTSKQVRKTSSRAKREAGLPKSYLMNVFKHFAKTKVSADVYPVLKEIMDKFFQRLAEDLETYAVHAKRKTIEVEDAELLLRRQGHVNDKVPLEVLIEKYLRLDQRKLLIPIATSGNVVIPKKR